LLLGATAINPDEITEVVRTQLPHLSRLAANLVAAERAEKEVWSAIAQARPVAVETVLSTVKYLPIVEAARGRGYRSRLIFVAVARVKTAVERVATRKRGGGHGVPETKIRARWVRAHDNLVRFMDAVDDVLVFSNESQEPVLVAERIGAGGRLVFHNRLALPEVTGRLQA